MNRINNFSSAGAVMALAMKTIVSHHFRLIKTIVSAFFWLGRRGGTIWLAPESVKSIRLQLLIACRLAARTNSISLTISSLSLRIFVYAATMETWQRRIVAKAHQPTSLFSQGSSFDSFECSNYNDIDHA